MAKRITDLTNTTSSILDDDYLMIDGKTYGTRKILASDLDKSNNTKLTKQIESQKTLIAMNDRAITKMNNNIVNSAYYYNSQMFGNLATCIKMALDNGYDVILKGTEKIYDPIEIDCRNKSLNITGTISPESSGIHFKNLKSGNINLNVIGGGDENLSSYGVRFSNCLSINAAIYGEDYRGTVLKVGGNNGDSTRVGKSNFKLRCMRGDLGLGCMRALEHGDSNADEFQDAFGSYEYIYDFNSSNGVLFQNSRDFTIKHYENLFWDSTRTKRSLSMINCRAVHIDNIAIGGRAEYLLYVENCNISANKIFTITEDDTTGDLITKGIKIYGQNNLINVLYHLDSLTKYALELENTASSYINFVNINCVSSRTKPVVVDGSELDLPRQTSFNTLLTNEVRVQNINGSWIKHMRSDAPAVPQYLTGVSKNSNEYRIVVVDENNNIVGYPFKVNGNGTVRMGTPSGTIGFYDNIGSTQQTVQSHATDLNTCISLTNEIRTALINLGLLKRESPTASEGDDING